MTGVLVALVATILLAIALVTGTLVGDAPVGTPVAVPVAVPAAPVRPPPGAVPPAAGQVAPRAPALAPPAVVQPAPSPSASVEPVPTRASTVAVAEPARPTAVAGLTPTSQAPPGGPAAAPAQAAPPPAVGAAAAPTRPASPPQTGAGGAATPAAAPRLQPSPLPSTAAPPAPLPPTATPARPAATAAAPARAIDPAGGFGPGVKVVGADVQPGTYRSLSGDGCAWARLSGTGGTQADVIASDDVGGSAIVTIAPTDRAFTSTGCAPWLPATRPSRSDAGAPFGPGTYTVNGDVAPGTWHSEVTESCYWARLKDFLGEGDSEIDNAHTESAATVTIAPTDAGFMSIGCGSWTRSG